MKDSLYSVWLPPVWLTDRLFEPGRVLGESVTMEKVLELIPIGLIYIGRNADGVGRFADNEGHVVAYVRRVK